jgi:Flp pilus assembly protein TadG
VRRLRRTRREDDGAAAVEFALLFPIFMVLAMGLIATGTAFSRQINVTQAAREASRYGATYDIAATGPGGVGGTLTTWLTTVDSAVCTAVNNGNACSAAQASNPLAGYDYRCVAFVTVTDSATPAVDTAHSGYRENGGASSGSGSCPAATAALIRNARYVQVVLSRDVKFNILFAAPTLHLDAVSTSPYEGKTTP